MNHTQIREKLAVLKSIISKMNINTIELINASAGIEVKLRKAGNSESELISLENEINQIINQYACLLIAERKETQR